MFNKEAILEQAKTYDSFYLYDESKILESTSQLKKDFKEVDFLYSIKANPNPKVVKSIFEQGFGADAASLAEVIISNKNGLSIDKIQYSAPGKTVKDIEKAIDISTIIADSVDEVIRIQEVANKKGIVAQIGIRINPNFTFDGMSGIPSKFGIDEEQVFENIEVWKKLSNIKIVGIHVHSRSQELNAGKIKSYYEKMFYLATKFQGTLNYELQFINMGSGMGVPYSKEDNPINTSYLGKEMLNLINEFKSKLPKTKIFIETGRFVVTKCGVYVTKVLDKKISCGKVFVILNNTLNGFIRPSLSQVVMNYSKQGNPPPSEPLFTCKNAFEFIALTEEKEEEEVTLSGNLCTAIDIIAKDITMPKLKYGDIVVITNAGSYGAVITPMQFSTPVAPMQLFLDCNGNITCG